MDEAPPAPLTPEPTKAAGSQRLFFWGMAAFIVVAALVYAGGLGAKEGLDVNTSSREQLLNIPGLSAEKADLILQQRPFANAEDFTVRMKGLPPEVTARLIPGLLGKPPCCMP